MPTGPAFQILPPPPAQVRLPNRCSGVRLLKAQVHARAERFPSRSRDLHRGAAGTLLLQHPSHLSWLTPLPGQPGLGQAPSALSCSVGNPGLPPSSGLPPCPDPNPPEVLQKLQPSVQGCSLQDGSSRGWACRGRESLYL